VLTFVEKNI